MRLFGVVLVIFFGFSRLAVSADYSVQLGVYASEQQANVMKNKLNDERAFVYLDAGVARVYVGRWSDQRQAVRVMDAFRAQGYFALVVMSPNLVAAPNALSQLKAPLVSVPRSSVSTPEPVNTTLRQKSPIVTNASAEVAPVPKSSVAPVQTAPAISQFFSISGFMVEGSGLLSEESIAKLLTPFVGEKKSFADVQLALEALQKAYTEAGYHAVQVTIPEQNIRQGYIRFQVVEGRLAKVSVESAQYFDAGNVRASVPSLVVGSAPRLDDLTAELKLANENPAKKVDLLMKNAGQQGQLEGVLSVKDESPLSFSAAADNSGNPDSGEARVSLGVQHANLTNRDDVLLLQGSTSVNYPDRYKSWLLSYHLPLYSLRSSVDAYAAQSDSASPQLAGGLMSMTGAGQVFGLRWNRLISGSGAWSHHAFVGLENKRFNNRFNIEGIDVSGDQLGSPDTEAMPVVLGLKGQWQGESSQLSWLLSYYQNLSGSASSVYESVGSRSDYRLWRYAADALTSTPMDWRLRFRLSGQQANDHLISGEQSAIGGYHHFRGIYDYSLSADNSRLLSTEVYTPNLLSSGSPWNLRGLVFVDHVVASNQVDGASQASLTSAGVGVRINHRQSLSFRVDVANLLEAPKGLAQESGDTYVHAGVNLVY